MSETITISPLGPDDADRLIALPGDIFDNPVDPAEARRFLGNDLNLMLVAEIGAEVAGFVSGTVLRHPDKRPWFFVNELGTREAFRRRGVATALMRALGARGADEGWAAIWLATEAENEGARGTYRHLAGEEEMVAGYGWSPQALRTR